MGAAGSVRAQQQFSIDAMVQAYQNMYDRLLDLDRRVLGHSTQAG